MQNLNDLEILLGSSVPIIVIESHEEGRLIELFNRLIKNIPKSLFLWTVTEGLKRLDVDMPAQRHNSKPIELLTQIKMTRDASIYLLIDFHPFLDDPVHVRLLKDIALLKGESLQHIVLISHEIKLPEELERYSARFELSMPDRSLIEMMVRSEAKSWATRNKDLRIVVEKKFFNQLVESLVGLPVDDARRLIKGAIEDDGALNYSDLSNIMQAKFNLLDQGGVLSFEYDTAKFADVGGLEGLKEWLQFRREIFNGEIQNPGLDAPKGIMLLGIQGCGKSLAAKAVAGSWGVPLLRLDFGSLYSKFYGESEKNLRESLKMAELMSPCVLWIDEIEKGISVGENDGGTSSRMLGTILTWMSENKEKVFIVATANNIEALPPELIRKGRLDEIFFVDLPDSKTRELIFGIHLDKRKQNQDSFNIESLGVKSAGFSGSEIEQAVVSSLYSALAQKIPLNETHLLDELGKTRPLSIVMAEKIESLRSWAEGRTVSAN
ncbi:MAG: AAA+ superfamily predicted ATPase [Gammaproteobacteria bacterium]|jgi:AAA+ superfamily predicted ATPase